MPSTRINHVRNRLLIRKQLVTRPHTSTMSDITDWEPLMKPEINWEEQYERQLRINEILITENKQINKIQDDNLEAYKNDLGFYKNRCQTCESDYAAYKESSQERFRILKAEIITSLRAINLCLLASINTEKQQLTHRARNFRMRHVNQIIENEINRFGDRQLVSYEDDF